MGAPRARWEFVGSGLSGNTKQLARTPADRSDYFHAASKLKGLELSVTSRSNPACRSNQQSGVKCLGNVLSSALVMLTLMLICDSARAATLTFQLWPQIPHQLQSFYAAGVLDMLMADGLGCDQFPSMDTAIDEISALVQQAQNQPTRNVADLARIVFIRHGCHRK